ncbi:MAG: hypothetical protein ACI8UO_005490 [Verrucomicrobiales bacterium]
MHDADKPIDPIIETCTLVTHPQLSRSFYRLPEAKRDEILTKLLARKLIEFRGTMQRQIVA